MIHMMGLTSMSGLGACACTSNRKRRNSGCIDVKTVDLFDDRLPINTAAPERKGEVVQQRSELNLWSLISLCH